MRIDWRQWICSLCVENSDDVHTYIHEHASNCKIIALPRLVTVKVRLTLNFLCRALVSIGVGPSPVSRLLLLLLHLIVPPGLLLYKTQTRACHKIAHT